MIAFHGPVPIFRSFDEDKAKAFYKGYLGFEIDWEHRFHEGAPLYMQLRLGDVILHLSEHHGDGSPGANIRIGCDDLKAYWHALNSKEYAYAKPGEPGETPWRSVEMTITDPFGNRLTFVQEASVAK